MEQFQALSHKVLSEVSACVLSGGGGALGLGAPAKAGNGRVKTVNIRTVRIIARHFFILRASLGVYLSNSRRDEAMRWISDGLTAPPIR